MPVLDSQKAFRLVRDLSFCYLCTNQFQENDKLDRDHLPPYSLFAEEDRNFPLILPAHQKCNQERSPEDQVISQIVGILHGRETKNKDRKMEFVTGAFPDGSPGIGIRRVDFKKIIRRWIRGFHAALYQEPLLDSNPAVFMTSPPFAEARIRGTDMDILIPPTIKQRIVEEIKRNRRTGTLDQIVCRNGKCRYECVWTQFDRGEWFCVYALDIYDWKTLGDIDHFVPQGCVGCYRRQERGTPKLATCATKLHFPIDNVEKLDPFGG